MAIYVPASRRRRTTIAIAIACAVAGLVAGVVVGRATSPTLADRVRDVQEQARQVTSQLRVAALHEDASTDAESNKLALQRARNELVDALADAPWIDARAGKALIADLDALDTRSSASAIEQVAKEIDTAFGISG